MDSLLFILNTVLPVFLIVFIGKILFKTKIIDDNFINKSSDLVFIIALPALIFQEVSALKLSDIKLAGELFFTFIYLTFTFTISFILAMIFIKDKKKVGVFAQGVFRGNYGIIALALLNNMFGAPGLAKGSIILSIATLCYNVYSTIGFIIPQHNFTFANIKKLLFKIITNPIIIGLVCAFAVLIIKNFYPDFMLPSVLKTTIKSFASLSLPVALIGIGGTISFNNLKENKILITIITSLRIFISPLIFTIIAVIIGFKDENLVALFFLFGVPTAAASFVLARSMDADSDLAANVVASTTIISVITLSAGIFILKYFNFI